MSGSGQRDDEAGELGTLSIAKSHTNHHAASGAKLTVQSTTHHTPSFNLVLGCLSRAFLHFPHPQSPLPKVIVIIRG
jgi:hypothetical protein